MEHCDILSITSTPIGKSPTSRSVSASLQPSGSGKERRPGRQRAGWLSQGMAGRAVSWNLTRHPNNVDKCGRGTSVWT